MSKPLDKELIFNHKKYPKTKWFIFSIYLIICFGLKWFTDLHKLVLVFVLAASFLGIVYFFTRLLHYKPVHKFPDIIYLLAFIGLTTWGFYTAAATVF